MNEKYNEENELLLSMTYREALFLLEYTLFKIEENKAYMVPLKINKEITWKYGVEMLLRAYSGIDPSLPLSKEFLSKQDFEKVLKVCENDSYSSPHLSVKLINKAKDHYAKKLINKYRQSI